MSEYLAVCGGAPVLDDACKVRWPIITREDKAAVARVLDSGELWGLYAPEMRALEEEFAAYCGTKYCLAMNSGTAALHCAISAVGIGPGDEVILSAYSILSAAAAVLHQNAIPVFVDIDPRTYNMDVQQAQAAISPRTKAIIPTHMHGLPADMAELLALAARRRLLVIEDATQAPGAEYRGNKTGSLAISAGFSVNSTMNLSGGEGGLFTTNSDEYRGKANMMRMFGELVAPNEGRKYQSYSMGWNYRTQEMTCALTRMQLTRLNEFNAVARRNAEYLTAELANIPGLCPPYMPEDRVSNFHKYCLRLEPEKLDLPISGAVFRDKLQAALLAEGVDAVRWQHSPVPLQPLFQTKQGYGKGCPWSCRKLYGATYEYQAEQFPVTMALLENSLVICSEYYPIYAQPLAVMERYVAAFHKVFANLEQVMRLDVEGEKQQVGTMQ